MVVTVAETTLNCAPPQESASAIHLATNETGARKSPRRVEEWLETHIPHVLEARQTRFR